jgi:ribosomal protein S18 acetylase RimI-like enzyme
MFPLTIKTVTTESDILALVKFIKQQPQNYPDHDKWVENKCIPKLRQNILRAFVVTSESGEVVGNAMYQSIGENKIELKHFRIDELFQNRDLGHFLLNQVFYEAGKSDIVLDTTVDNFSAVEFFIHNKFKIKSKEKLYLPTQDEYIMVRENKK